MAEQFKPFKSNASNFNNGEKYEHGDGLQPETINRVIEATLYVQGLATNPIDVSEINQTGEANASIVTASDGSARLKLSNLKGGTGEKGSQGVGIARVENEYAINNSPDTAPNVWHSEPMAPNSNNRYAWIRQTIYYTNATTQTIPAYVYGVAGEKGDASTVTMVNGQTGSVNTYKGMWNNTTTYYRGDIVSYLDGIGSSNYSLYLYISGASSSGHAPTDTSYWKIFGKAYSVATEGADGLMSSTDKDKLDTVARGAEVNQNAFSKVKVGDTTVSSTSKTDTVEIKAGANVTVTADTNEKIVTISAIGGAGGVSGTTTTVTLIASAWINKLQTVSVEGVTVDSVMLVSPRGDPSNYANAGIYCSAQGEGALTFTCKNVPTADIAVNIARW